MTIIPLRAYNREIEGLIDNGQLDEAVAHCRHILTTFPKHIASYRLLGKSHLEQQRISDATDIFQRVLSAIPDDFIANVGMSIIREDENNLDASIWHMELAYEAQPSNVAIQDELRRLYGRRDGIQPPKPRYTRGALARMYAKGGLFDQAIAELRGAISDDPNRPDLQLLLAQMFFQTSQRVEAVETCVYILKKLPFCLAANQILAVCLPESEIADSRSNYRQIAISMDPYFAFASADSITSDQVAENAVNIEKLEWKSGIQVSEATAQPTWAASLGISLEKPKEEKLPDWLNGTETPKPIEPTPDTQPGVSPFIWDTQEVEKIIIDGSKPESEVPDWMKDAGWKPATEEATLQPTEALIEPTPNTPTQEESPIKADIPDWLRGIAPEGVLEDETPGSQSKETETSIPWLEKQTPGPTDSIIQWLEDTNPEIPSTSAISGSDSIDITEEEIPDWLKDLDLPVSASESVEISAEETPAISVLPAAFIVEGVVNKSHDTDEPQVTPSDLSTDQINEAEPIAAELPTSSADSTIVEPAPEPAEELPEWLSELSENPPEESLLSTEEIHEENLPEIQGGEPILETHATELPDADKLMPSEQPVVSPHEEPPVEPLIIAGAAVSEISTPSEEPQSELTNPDETKKMDEVSPSLGEVAAFAWLERLAAEQGANEKELITPSEELEETPPEWVKLEVEPVTSEELFPEAKPETGAAPAIPSDGVPEWIKGLGEPSEIEEGTIEPSSGTSTEPETAQVEGLPAWLHDLEEPVTESEILAVTQEDVSDEAAVPESLEWKEEELPEWLKEISGTPPSEVVPEIGTPQVVEETPASQAQSTSDWTPEVVIAAGLAAAKLAESNEGEPTSVSEEPTSSQPPIEIPTETVLTKGVVAEELVSTEADIAPAPAEDMPVPEIATQEPQPVTFDAARNAVSQGQPSQAAEYYSGLIKQDYHLEEVIKDLQDALYRFPVDVDLWVTLGDAYFRTDDLQEALNAYVKAEDLVR
jgi:tetratricopeptide (TPR) repeat protein